MVFIALKKVLLNFEMPLPCPSSIDTEGASPIIDSVNGDQLKHGHG